MPEVEKGIQRPHFISMEVVLLERILWKKIYFSMRYLPGD